MMAQFCRVAAAFTSRALLRGLVVLAITTNMNNTAGSVAGAAPVTFTYEAEVSSVVTTNGGAGLPLPTPIGGKIFATFTFEPGSGGPVYMQSNDLRLQWSSLSLETDSYEIAVANDRPDWIPLTGSIADPFNTPIDDRGPGGVRDDLTVSCLGSLATPYCGLMPGQSNIGWRALAKFAGGSDVLNSVDLTVDLTPGMIFLFEKCLFRL